VHRLMASCLSDACRLQALIDVSKYPDDVEVPSFQRLAVCGKCGGRRVDVRLERAAIDREPHGEAVAVKRTK
jgi:hypothetical protein